LFHGYLARFYARPYLSCIEILETGMRTGVDIGDIIYGWYSAICALFMRFCGGQSLPAIYRDEQRYLDFLRETTRGPFDDMIDFLSCTGQCAQAMRGLTGGGVSSMTGEGFEQGDFEENRDRVHKPLARVNYHVLKCQLHVYAGEWAQAVAEGAKALP